MPECQIEQTRILAKLKQKLINEKCILSAYAYGSVIKALTGEKEWRKESDIDISIVESPSCELHTNAYYNDLIGEIEGHKPDVTTTHPLKAESPEKILSECYITKEHTPVLILK
jgi:predicted nucleotidyltransferase